MDVRIAPVTRDRLPVLERLRELWHYDFSEILGDDVDEDGIYGFGDLLRYFAEPGWSAMFIRVDGKLAGFLLTSPTDEGRNLDNFFVMRKYRRLGIGRDVVAQLFSRLPGAWTLTARPQNQVALAFWRSVLPAGFTEGTRSDSGVERVLFTVTA
jgi:predicted acetyltransferase